MKKICTILVVCLITICILFVSCFIKYGMLILRVGFAHEQIMVFEELKQKAMIGNIEEAENCIDYATKYYPSDSKQPIGTRLDVIVETARTNAVSSIIDSIKQKKLNNNKIEHAK